MKGDFSRQRINTDAHYTSVLMQQGRVQLDSDANEQRAIEEHLRLTALRDVVGATGAPQDNAGFGIAPASGGLQIGAGRFYVDGLLCENPSPLDFAAQSMAPDGATPLATLLTQLRGKQVPGLLLRLEAWQRYITAVDDSGIREVALGEADTAGRLQTAWRVLAQPVAATADVAGVAAKLQAMQSSLQPFVTAHGGGQTTAFAQMTAAVTALQASGAGAAAIDQARTARNAAVAMIATYRQTGQLTRSAQVDTLIAAVNALGTELAQQPSAQAYCGLGVYTPLRVTGALQAQALPVALPPAGITSPAAGYRGLENQLYRVEIHTGGAAGQATFKWSRDNGSVLTQILSVAGATLQVASLGPDTTLGFAAGQWVEISDDSAEFASPPSQPGALLQIQSVDPTQSPPTVTLSAAPPAVNPNRHAKLRRWDQTGTNATMPLQSGTWVALENGIQVQFSPNGGYLPGDHWLIPARTATGAIDWPLTAGTPSALDPLAEAPREAALAFVHLDAGGNVVADDCRTIFKPLGQLTPPPAPPPALHVTAISWQNDDVMTLDTLVFKGLSVTLDGAPTGPVDGRNFVVTLDAPPGNGASGTALRPMVLNGTVAISGDTLAWTLPLFGWIDVETISGITNFTAAGLLMKAQVTLKGHRILGTVGGAVAWLDGQSFGKSGTRADGSARVDLSLPSGNGARASDFEGWFDVAPIPVPALALSTGAVTLSAAVSSPAVTATLTLSFNGLGNTLVTLSSSTSVNNQISTGSPYISIPASATLTKGQTSAQFAVSIIGNPGAGVTATITISAVAALPSGFAPSGSATLTITGFQPLIIGTITNIGSILNVGSLQIRGT
jgi:hypothetical protein